MMCFFMLKIKERRTDYLARPSKSVAVMSKNLIEIILRFHFTDFLYIVEGVVVWLISKKFNIKYGEY